MAQNRLEDNRWVSRYNRHPNTKSAQLTCLFSQAWNLTLELCKSHITIRPEVLIEGSVTCMKLGKEKFKKAVTLYCKYSRVQKQSSFF